MTAIAEIHRRRTHRRFDGLATFGVAVLLAIYITSTGNFRTAALTLVFGGVYLAWASRSVRTGRLDGGGLTLRSGTLPWEEVVEVEAVVLRWPTSLLSDRWDAETTRGFTQHASSPAVVVTLRERRIGLWMEDEEAAERLVRRVQPFLGRISGTADDVPEALRQARDVER